ncbi:MAG: O-antigen ligase family protein, partial [bacterium]
GPWGSIVRSDFQGRVTAGLGNPDFFAGYLLTAWPLALALWIRASSTMAKTWWAFTFAALWAAIFLTESRAGWLGGIVGLAVFALFFFWKNPEAKKTRLGLAGAVLVLILATCILPLGSRLSGLAHPQNASIQFRQEVWKGVWNLITAHPIAGTGFGTFEAAYPPYRPEALMLHQAQRSYEVSHPHNWILEWTADEGGMGLVLLFLFAFAILSQWWKLYAARAIPRALGAGAFAVFAGAAVDNLFDVNASLPSTLIPLLFVAALPVALSNRFSHFPGFPIRSRTWDLKNYKLYLAPVTLLAVLLMLAQVQSAMRHQLTDGMLKKAESFSQQRKWDEAIGMYGRILKLDGSNVEALYFRGASYLDRKSEGDAALALADFQALQTRNPDYVLVHFKKAEALKRLNRLPEAQSEMDQAVRLDPVLIFQDSTFVRAQNWTGKKRYREALALYQKLLFDYPACVPLLLNTANTLVERGKGQSALELYRRVLVYDPGNSDALSNAAAVRTSMGRNGKD